MNDWFPLAGVVIAQFVLVGLYFVKQEADDKRRWHERRLLAYSAFLAREEQCTRNMGKVAADAEARDAYQQWQSSLGQVMLLGSDAAREAATEMIVAYLEGRARINRGELDVDDAHVGVHRHREHFLGEVRKGLKLHA